MGKYTQGPWKVSFSDGSGPSHIVAGDNKTVAKVRWGCGCCEDDSPLEPEEQANVHLMSAAPEMLEALKFALSIIGHPDDAGSKFIAAVISKAEG